MRLRDRAGRTDRLPPSPCKSAELTDVSGQRVGKAAAQAKIDTASQAVHVSLLVKLQAAAEQLRRNALRAQERGARGEYPRCRDEPGRLTAHGHSEELPGRLPLTMQMGSVTRRIPGIVATRRLLTVGDLSRSATARGG